MLSEIERLAATKVIASPPVETLSLLEQMSADTPPIRLKAAAAEMMLGFDRTTRDVEKLHSDSRDQLLSYVDILPLGSPERERFFQSVQKLIDLAESRATDFCANREQLSKILKSLQHSSSPGRAVLSELAEYFIHQVDELIESLLEQALFLRAFRAEHIGYKGRGQTFDTPEELKAFLGSLPTG